MSKVRTSAYRRPPTPEGLRAIEEGSLEWFDTEMFSNFNTEVLEEYLEEKNRAEGFGRAAWKWNQAVLGLIIGIFFAVVNQYVGLKVGMVVSGSWYVAYLSAMAMRWKPGEVNISAATSTGAAMICTGFVFTYPAIYLLAYSPDYQPWLISRDLLLPNSWALAGVAMVATILGGFLGVMYFIIFRRVWLIEDPLLLPGFEAPIKLMDIANDVASGAGDSAKQSIRLVGLSTLIVAAFTFLRDFPLLPWGADRDARVSILDHTFGGHYYHHGVIMLPRDHALATYTWLGLELTPMMGAIGWFMKFRVALLVSLGTFFTWFVITPLAGVFDVAVYYPADGLYHNVSDWEQFGIGAAMMSYSYIARPIAIGCILGGGLTGLLKMAPIFKTTGADVIATLRGGDDVERRDYIKGKGWYEWPVNHILVMMLVALTGITLIFATEFGIVPSFVFALVLCLTTFALGAIAVKVMGETGIEPVSGTSFIVLLMLVVLFDKVLMLSSGTTALLGLVGTTVYGGAISMSGDVITDFKAALYVGNRPMHIMKAELVGIVPGAVISGIFAGILSLGLAKGELTLYAPQANAFASFAQVMLGGKTPWTLLAIGVGIGIFMELLTGMGTAFGLGMYLPLVITLPMVLGGALRDIWEQKFLEPAVKKLGLTEKEKTMRLLNTYMIATGLIVGEAIMGTVLAIYYVWPLLTGG